MIKTLSTIAIATALMFGIASTASGQQPSERTVVFIPDGVLNAPIPDWLQGTEGQGVDTRGEELGALTFRVEGRTCATLPLTGATGRVAGGRSVELGGASQAAECARPDSRIQIFDSRGRQVQTQLRLSPGQTIVLEDLAFLPPTTGSGVSDGLSSSSPTSMTTILILAAALGGVAGFMAMTLFTVQRRLR